jgi:hypothetical protein
LWRAKRAFIRYLINKTHFFIILTVSPKGRG